MNRMKRMTINLLGAGLLLGATAAKAEETPGQEKPPFEKVLKQIGEGKIEETYTNLEQVKLLHDAIATPLGQFAHQYGYCYGGNVPQTWFDKLDPADRNRLVEDDRKANEAHQKGWEDDKKAFEAALKAAIEANPEWAAAERRLKDATAKLEALKVNDRGEPKDGSRKLTDEEKAAAAAAAKEYKEAEGAARRFSDACRKGPEMFALSRKAGGEDTRGRKWGWFQIHNVLAAAGHERHLCKVKTANGFKSIQPWVLADDPVEEPGLPRVDESGAKPGTAKTVDLGGGKLELVWIPAGEFMMGSRKGEVGRFVIEPRHRVKLTKGFWMGKYEVTQEQWQRVMGNNPSWFTNAGPKAPVEYVSLSDVQQFLRKLNKSDAAGTGTFRLPTEAEWEWACRAGTDKPLYTGAMTLKGANNSPELDAIAWYGGNSGVEYEGGWGSAIWPDKQYDHRVAGTHPVGQKKPNAWGMHDMLGNVWEWCQDVYRPYIGPRTVGEFAHGGESSDPNIGTRSVTDPVATEPGWDGGQCILRGGCWADIARYCRSPSRAGRDSFFINPGTGFRVVWTETDKAAGKEGK